MTLGEKIQQIRKAAGLSQEQLASMIDVSRQAVSKWETDQSLPDLDKVILLSQVFHISTDELLGVRAAKQNSQAEKNLDTYVKQNLKRRIFTAGWLTALIGAVLLVAEYLSLYVIRSTAIRLDTIAGLGFYQDIMRYAKEAPMSIIFPITGVIIAAGIMMIIGSFLLSGNGEKETETAIRPDQKQV